MKPSRKVLRYALLVLFLGSLGIIFYGFSLKADQLAQANRYIGAGTVLIFLVTMPLFLVLESRNKQMKDYLLNEENILKMRENQSKKAKKSPKNLKK
ncbi:MAG: hypothetical protein VW236_04515 [Flavobacteriaceae bacterium]|jgi:hypothetical protein